MTSMKCLLCAVVLVALFGYGTSERCGNDDNCEHGCCYYKGHWECCTRSYVYVYVGVGSTVGVLVIVGVVVFIVCLMKSNARSGRVIHAAPPAMSLAGSSHVTALNNTGHIQSGNFLYPPGSAAYPPPGATAPPPMYSTNALHYQGKSHW